MLQAQARDAHSQRSRVMMHPPARDAHSASRRQVSPMMRRRMIPLWVDCSSSVMTLFSPLVTGRELWRALTCKHVP